MMTTDRFIQLVNNRWKFSLFLLWKLPSAWMAGVRVVSMDARQCTTVVPYRWLSQNPFRSTYFACLAMAAEMSSGLLSMAYTGPKISMLVTGMEALFMKKAVTPTYFTCDAGEQIAEAIRMTMETGEPVAITVTVNGTNAERADIARFLITWSFKRKNS